jgi:hypothetical protein
VETQEQRRKEKRTRKPNELKRKAILEEFIGLSMDEKIN